MNRKQFFVFLYQEEKTKQKNNFETFYGDDLTSIEDNLICQVLVVMYISAFL